MKVKDLTEYTKRIVFNGNCRFKMGDVVINKGTNEIGVIVDIFDDGSFQTDKFNAKNHECELATHQQLMQFRKELIPKLTLF